MTREIYREKVLRARCKCWKKFGENEVSCRPCTTFVFFTLPFGRPSWVTRTLFRLPALYSVVCRDPESRVHVALSTMGGSLNLSVSLASVFSPGSASLRRGADERAPVPRPGAGGARSGFPGSVWKAQ